jgi:hypothetical protein
VKLYVCWGTFGGNGHACAKAYNALRDAGHEPEVKKVYGWGALPDVLNPGRKEVIRLTGQRSVPVLATDDGATVAPSQAIVEWAKAHPAGAATSPSA